MSRVRITLREFPVDLFDAFDEATEGLLRDFLLTAMSGHEPFSVVDVASARQAKRLIADAVAAVRSGHSHTALRLRLSSAEAANFGILQAVLEHANRLAYDGQLLLLPVLPEIAAFRNWMCEQVVTQAAGAKREPWAPSTDTNDTPGVPPATWQHMSELPADEAWVVGDDTNRIIGASRAALELLGWDNLVGERIVAIVPPAFRDRHLASFTRGVVSGHHRLLDQPLLLATWTRDGQELPITLTLTKHVAERQRTVYLARIEPR